MTVFALRYSTKLALSTASGPRRHTCITAPFRVSTRSLSPVAERPRVFYLGNREYDPLDVGYHTEKLRGGFRFDTSIRGNSNSGHEFNNGSGKGIIGPLLTPNERRAIIEYLKSL